MIRPRTRWLVSSASLGSMALVWALPLCAFASVPPGYTLTDLGVLNGGAYSEAYAINNSGQVVGSCNVPGLGERGFLWDQGTLTHLGQGCASDINSQGQVVGGGYHGAWLVEDGYYWQNGTRTALSLGAFAINDSGLVVGQGRGYSNQMHAVMWQTGANIADLFPLGAETSCATGVNGAGEIVGWAATSLSPTRFAAFLWRGGFTYYLCDLGNRCVSVDINAHGQVVSSANNKKYVLGNGDTVLLDEAFLWENGTVTPLGTLGYDSHAYAINDNGQIVGDANYACIWDGGVIHDLTEMIVNAPGWELTTAYDINELGQIVGVGLDPSTHQRHGFLLTPIPEPATLSLLALGGLVLLRRRVRA